MKTTSANSMSLAHASGRTTALRCGATPHRAASDEVEVRLDGLLRLTIGMFVFAMAAVGAVGILFF